MSESDDREYEKGSKSPFKNRDFLVLAGVAALLVGGFIALTFKLIDQEDRHVRDVERVHIAEGFSADEIGKNEADETVDSMLSRNPNVEDADFSTITVNDRLMKKIARLKMMKRLNLSHTKITDKGLERIAKIPLTELDLTGTAITDDGLKIVAKITSLEKLVLAETQVTDAGLPAIVDLSELVNLSLSNTKVTDKGLPILLKLKSLQRLFLSNTAVTDNGLKTIAQMDLFGVFLEHTAITGGGLRKYLVGSRLRKVGLESCNLADEDVESILLSFPGVVILDVGRTKISDAGLMQLAKLTRLKSLKIRYCKNITEDGINSFSQVKPRCKIETSYM